MNNKINDQRYSSKNSVTLIEVKSINAQKIRENLEPLGYIISDYSQSDYSNNYENIDSQLVIVDVISHGYHALNNMVNLERRVKPEPPILAIINETENNKRKLFMLGATDYISCPLIPDELKNRVIHIAKNYRNIELNHKLKSKSREDTNQLLVNSVAVRPNEYLLAKKISKYLFYHLSNDISMSDLTRQIGVNRNKLSSIFKEHYGSSPFAWLREQRMKEAARLLLNTDKAVDIISQEVGYNDLSNFSTCFKRYYTYSPLKYRKRMHETNKIVHQSKVS